MAKSLAALALEVQSGKRELKTLPTKTQEAVVSLTTDRSAEDLTRLANPHEGQRRTLSFHQSKPRKTRSI